MVQDLGPHQEQCGMSSWTVRKSPLQTHLVHHGVEVEQNSDVQCEGLFVADNFAEIGRLEMQLA